MKTKKAPTPRNYERLLDTPHFERHLENAAREVPRRDAALGPSHPGTLDAVHHYGSLLQAHGQRLGGAEGKRLVDQATPLLKRASVGREQRGLRR